MEKSGTENISTISATSRELELLTNRYHYEDSKVIVVKQHRNVNMALMP